MQGMFLFQIMAVLALVISLIAGDRFWFSSDVTLKLILELNFRLQALAVERWFLGSYSIYKGDISNARVM